jgi:uncharacterized protein YjbJ (UPF0337 family)
MNPPDLSLHKWHALLTSALFESVPQCALHPFETQRGIVMNQDTIQGQWKQLSGQLKQHWGKLTDDDLKVAEGNSEYLSGRLQERYGMARDEAEKQVKEFEKKLRHH